MIRNWIYNRLANSQFLYDLFCDFMEDAGLDDEEIETLLNRTDKTNDENIPARVRRSPRKQRKARKRRKPRSRR